jgi:hypothetical protein
MDGGYDVRIGAITYASGMFMKSWRWRGGAGGLAREGMRRKGCEMSDGDERKKGGWQYYGFGFWTPFFKAR